MTLTRGRVLRGDEALHARELARPPYAPGSRRIPAVVADAAERARTIVESAESQAARIVAEADCQAADLKLAAQEVGRAEAAATLAAWSIKLARAEATMDERALARSIELAKMLAERLLGSALALDSAVISTLARQALDEARGARKILLTAHPDDAAVLRQELALGGDLAEVTVVDDPTLAPGDLRLETELGTLDARVEPRLERLTRRLRESIRR